MSAAVAAAATAALISQNTRNRNRNVMSTSETINTFPQEGRYDSQKRQDWNTFRQYLRNNRPTLAVSRCSGVHVIEFLRYIDQFGKTKVHDDDCPLVGGLHGQLSCSCPLRQAWASLDGLIGRLFAAYEDGGLPGRNPFGEKSVQLYLGEVRESQAKGRRIVKH